MSYLYRLKALAFTRSYYVAALALAALFLVWFFFFRNTNPQLQTLTVHPGDFVEEVSVSGTVKASQDVDLGFTESGRIAGVYARVGDRVGAGSTLASIENGDLRASVQQKQAALAVEQAKLAALKAGTRPEEVAVARSAVASDRLALLNSIRDAYRASDDAVRNTIDQFLNNPRTNPQLNFKVSDPSVEAPVDNGRFAIEATLVLWQEDVAALTVQDDLSAAAARASINLSAVSRLLSDSNAALNRAIVTQSTSQATIDGYITAVGTARSNVNTALASLTTTSATLDAAEKNLSLKQAGSTGEDIAAQKARVEAAQADVASAEAQLQKTHITAPFSGIVTVVDAKAGAIASPNTPLISLLGTTLQIESYVPEINIAHVKAGNPAVVTLDAYGENVPFDAKVVSVDPAETVRDGVSTYRAILVFARQDARIRSGMTANIAITTDNKSDVIGIPQGAVFLRGGSSYVHVEVAGKIEERQVTTGDLSALGNIEIRSGLSDGDVVVLSK